MRRVGLVVTLLALSIAFSAAPRAKAETPSVLFITPGEPYGVRVHLEGLTANQNLQLKLCFSDALVSPFHCQGQTWSGDDWLKQLSPWASFPIQTASDSGDLSLLLTGQSDGGTLPAYLHVMAKDKSKPLATYQVTEAPDGADLTLQAFDDDGNARQAGYFSLMDSGHERLIPVFDDQDSVTTTPNHEVSVAYIRNANDVPAYDVFSLDGDDAHTIKIHAPIVPEYKPGLIAPNHLYTNEDGLAHIATAKPYSGRVAWYSDGELVQKDTSLELPLAFEGPGTYRLEAFLLDSGEHAAATVTVTAYKNIAVIAIKPHVASGASEELTIQNNNDFAVLLHNWRLKSRTSSTTIPIEATLAAHAATTVSTKNKLLNNNGHYDLINNANELVDAIDYGTVDEDAILTRVLAGWLNPTAAAATDTTADNSPDEAAEATGTVTNPHGRSFDLDNDDDLTHIIIDKSYDGDRPSLHTGDTVRVTGVWQTNTKGSYIRVMQGDTFVVVKRYAVAKAKAVKKMAAAKGKSPSKTASLIPVAQAADKPFGPSLVKPASAKAAPTAVASARSTAARRLMISLVLLIGILLSLPKQKKTSL